MDKRLGLFVLLAAGLLCLSLAPVSRAETPLEEDELDVEDELDLGLAGAEDEELEDIDGDAQDEAPAAPQAPPTPKVTPETL